MTDKESLQEELVLASEGFWKGVRGAEPSGLKDVLHSEFRATGFPLESGSEPAAPAGPAATAPAAGGTLPKVQRSPAESSQAMTAFFGEGGGLTNLQHRTTGVQVQPGFGVVTAEWMAEVGLGQGGSPSFVSGLVALSFLQEGGRWRLVGWLGSSGPHEAQTAERRQADVRAIREQILRVFEAYRQKDHAMLRRTHTADWRGFALSSAVVGKGIEAYMRAAQGAMISVQFEEYRILEFDAVFYGDVAIVPYVACVAGKTAQGRMESRLRVMDVYLREPSGWNQVASNVCLHPQEMRGS